MEEGWSTLAIGYVENPYNMLKFMSFDRGQHRVSDQPWESILQNVFCTVKVAE